MTLFSITSIMYEMTLFEESVNVFYRSATV